MIIEKLYKHLEKQGKKRWTQHANRCSSIGFPCTRKLIYDIVRSDAKPKIDPKLQVIFNEGNRQELIIKRDLLDIGIELNKEQCLVEFLPYRLTGHIDGTWLFRRTERLIEIKTMSTHIFDKINSLDDLNNGSPWHTQYVPQTQLYMKGMNLKKGLFILKNKNTGELKEIEILFDNKIVKEMFAKCDIINPIVDSIRKMLIETYQIKEITDFDKQKDFEDYVDIKQRACQEIENMLPERLNEEKFCENCDYNHICLPDEIREQLAKVWIGEGLYDELVERENLKPAFTKYNPLHKKIRQTILNSNEKHIICRDFEIKVSKSNTVDIKRIIGKKDKDTYLSNGQYDPPKGE